MIELTAKTKAGARLVHLVALVGSSLVAATILFVVGTTIERSQARAGEQQAASTNERPAGGVLEILRHDQTTSRRLARTIEHFASTSERNLVWTVT